MTHPKDMNNSLASVDMELVEVMIPRKGSTDVIKALNTKLNAVRISVRVWLDTWHSDRGLFEITTGRFYVRYPDGQCSRPFYYSTACQYAGMFGGQVVHRATGREL